jgi:proline-specific peptidase
MSCDYLLALEALAESGREVVFYDQLGAGHSDQPNDVAFCTIEYFISELDDIRRALALERIHLLGHSWGGMLAMEYALRRPPGLLSLVAASTTASMPRLIAEISRQREQLPLDLRTQVSQDSLLAYMRRHICRLEAWPEILIRTLEQSARNDFVMRTMVGPSIFEITGSLREWDVTHRLGEIDLPTLVTCGRHDQTSPALAGEIAGRIRAGELRIFEDSSHTPHLEEPGVYLEVLAAFLTRAGNVDYSAE